MARPQTLPDAEPQRREPRTLAVIARRLPLHVALIGIVVIWSLPTIALIISSFREPSAVASSGWWTVVKHPFDFTLDNYDRVLGQRGMGQAFLNSLIITIPSTILSLITASLAAYAFAWMRFPARNLLFLVVVGLLVVPLQMTLIPVLRLLSAVTVD
jgi:alpha-glucoside transport system permease protein